MRKLESQSNSGKIVLVSPGHQRLQVGAVVHLPIAILSLASWLCENGNYSNRLTIIDTQIHQAKPDHFKDAMVIGISAMTGGQIKYGLEVANIAKKVNPNAVIVWGGVHPTLLPKQTIKHRLVDVVVIGEGEQTFLEVVDAIANGFDLAGIPGTCVEKPDGEIVLGASRSFLNMDDLPLPAYDLVNIENYHEIQNQFDYQSSRGCPFRCAFCYNTVFCGRNYRKKSAPKVLEELSYLYKKYSIQNFGFVDDEFFIDRNRINEIFTALPKIGKFSITASCRLDIIQKFPSELIDKMKFAGVSQIFFGAESGSDEILVQIQKDISTKDILNGAKYIAEKGIRPNLSFMAGFPGERQEDFEKTIDLILDLWKIHPLVTINGIFPFNPYPGTALYQKALDMGFKAPQTLDQWGEWTFQYQPDTPWMDRTMKKWIETAFYMVRFKYYFSRYEEKYKDKYSTRLLKIVIWPLMVSITIRLKNRWFGLAWEWKLFAFLARKTFGYL